MKKSGNGIQILVVDDSPVSRKVLEHALSDEPYTLVFAESGEEALRLFQERRPALVITDWMLPDSSGVSRSRALFRFSRSLRSSSEQLRAF